MEERVCDLFCFRECSQEYDTLINKERIDPPNKLSLKGLIHNSAAREKKGRGMISQVQFEKWRNNTNRSKQENEEQRELQLFRQKAELERDLQHVNYEMIQLNEKYQETQKKLETIREEIARFDKRY